MTPLCEIRLANRARRHEDFGILDERGRKVGAQIWTSDARFVELPAGSTCGHRMEPGDYFTADVQATRDGACFGASTRGAVVKTEAERDAWIAKRVGETRKRYAKKYAA